MFQTKVVEKIKIHTLYPITFSKNRAVYETMSKNIVQPGKSQMVKLRRVACCVRKPRTHGLTHTQKYVILIAFPRQEWFCERASVLRCTYIACLVQIFTVVCLRHNSERTQKITETCNLVRQTYVQRIKLASPSDWQEWRLTADKY
jgi:hypothetical protein